MQKEPDQTSTTTEYAEHDQTSYSLLFSFFLFTYRIKRLC